MSGETPDAAELLGEEYERFESVLAERRGEPIAVLGAPFAGRETVLDEAAARLDATRVRLDPGDSADAVRSALDDGPVVIDDCQHLYERRIGGFDALDGVLDALATAEATVVTGWNRYAWAYLAAVRDLDGGIPHRFEVGPVATERLAELLLARYEEMPRFVADDGTSGAITLRRRSVGWGEYAVSVPLPAVNPAAVAGWGGGDPDPRDVVFERLAGVSGRNLGVATALWEGYRSAEMRPSDVAAAGDDLDLDRETAFGLRIVLAKERVRQSELAEVLGDACDRVLGRLDREGLVEVGDEYVGLRPEAVPTAHAATERGRIL